MAVILGDDWDTFCPYCPARWCSATGETYDFEHKNYHRRFRASAF
jgi:hypothetical protein